MLTDQNIESEFTYAYLHAIASRGGIICKSAIAQRRHHEVG